MPRRARGKSSSGIYHTMMRGVGRGNIFADAEDKVRFIETLIRFKRLCGFLIYGYCLMSNHLHLLIKEQAENISEIIKRIGVSYVSWYNTRHDRSGHLFQGRFKSEAVEDDRYLLAVLRYIHQNPVKAGMVKKVSGYRWSSYTEYLSEKPQLIDTDFVLELFHADRFAAVKAFEEFMGEYSEGQYLEYREHHRKRISDEELRQLIKKVINADDIRLIQQMHRSERNRVLQHLKETDVSIRQLSRVTGLGRNIIERA